jgi:hypothetical protein
MLRLGSAAMLGAVLIAALLGQSSPPAPAAAAGDGDRASTVNETPAEVRQRLERMTAEDRENLRRRSERFYEKLSPQEQQRLRDLHEQLGAHPNEQRLRDVLSRYTQWLRTLSAADRSKLLALPADERIARIKELKQEQETRRFRGFAGFSGEAEGTISVNPGIIYAWLDKIIERNEELLLGMLRPERRESFESDKPDRRRLRLMYAVWTPRWARRGPPEIEEPPDLITQADIDTLSETLPPEAKTVLAEAKTPEERRELVERWARAMLFARRTPVIPQETLEAFFQELPARDQAQLEELPRDQMLRELERMYISGRGFRSYGGRDGDGGGRFQRGGGRPSFGPDGERGGPGERGPGDLGERGGPGGRGGGPGRGDRPPEDFGRGPPPGDPPGNVPPPADGEPPTPQPM